MYIELMVDGACTTTLARTFWTRYQCWTARHRTTHRQAYCLQWKRLWSQLCLKAPLKRYLFRCPSNCLILVMLLRAMEKTCRRAATYWPSSKFLAITYVREHGLSTQDPCGNLKLPEVITEWQNIIIGTFVMSLLSSGTKSIGVATVLWLKKW